MPITPSRPALVLVGGLTVVLAAALAPAGLAAERVPQWSWAVWTLTFMAALAALRLIGWPLGQSLRRLAWLVPLVAVLALPAGAMAPSGQRATTVVALGARALASASAGLALAVMLGPLGVSRAIRALRLPPRLADIVDAMLASLVTLTHQVRRMLRAREARRPHIGAWPLLLARPVETTVSFGRFAAALLLRTLERAEALERAREARGGGDR